MGRAWTTLWIAVNVLTGCTHEPSASGLATLPTVDLAGARTDAANAALEANQVKALYENCVNRLGEDAPGCKTLRWMYDDAKMRYHAATGTPSSGSASP
ncbi:protein of unknown function [Candidatus Methylocalor cossyra]|uniref:Entry exclusion lipoprotein TrbK n=1 Tax=Candidatus Methylocalor cossyra TaxID=3108543 RepID=A0ABM9NFJ5_9GAMM